MEILEVNEDNIVEVLANMFCMDEDFIGNNGKEFTSKEALEAGYSSDAKYYAKRSYDLFEDTMDLEDMIFQMVKHFERLHGNFWDIKVATKNIKGKLVLSVCANIRE